MPRFGFPWPQLGMAAGAPLVSCALNRGGERVLQQHGDRQWTHAARNWTEGSGYLFDRGMHVADEDRAAALERFAPPRAGREQMFDHRAVSQARDADVDHSGTRPDEFLRDEC